MASTQQQLKATDRRVKVAALYLEGYRQAEIAVMLGVVKSTISKDIKKIRQWWKEEAADAYNGFVDQAMAEIAKLKRTHYEAWEASKGDRTTDRNTIRKTTPPANADAKESEGKEVAAASTSVVKTHAATSKDGNIAHLREIHSLIRTELDVVGGYAKDRREDEWMKAVIADLEAGRIDPYTVAALWPSRADFFFRKAAIDLETISASPASKAESTSGEG